MDGSYETAAAHGSYEPNGADTPADKQSIRAKVRVLELAVQLGSVSRACKIMGYSRDSFYRFKALYAKGGEAALQGFSRRRPLLKNRVPAEVEAAVVALALQRPSWGQARVAGELRARGLKISAAGVRCVWLRNGLQTQALRLQACQRQSEERPGPP